MTGLVLDGVSFAANHRPVLRDVDLGIAGGSVTALLGPSGSGKTTLLRLLHGLSSPTSGLVRLDGHAYPVRGAARRSLLRRFGYVQQQPGFLHQSARANVRFMLKARGLAHAHHRRRVEEALERVGLEGRADEIPVHFSGGERQRLALARALVTAPDVVLLDEFTNQVDPEWEERLERIVDAERRRGCTVVLVTHQVAQARRLADAAAFLFDGRVVESGPAARVLRSPQTELAKRFLDRAG